ncbi:hypothetical protein [Halobacillus sp. Marseille-Q1614]|uniref:YphA family membrane protein n=1 Tax=Halobacillus sp. Marseille-Q1614 TaxID=2709134 RepID=UPI00157012F8|nr:hypothetical protein [Halobacillus sp. Marseille-Q1614]
MNIEYYWFSWFAFILLAFFIPSQIPKKQAIMAFVLLSMINYSIIAESSEYLMWSLGFHITFGVYFWAEPKPVFNHLWLIIVVFLSTLLQLFIIVNPVWIIFPGAWIILVAVIFLIQLCVPSLASQIGLWILMNAGGAIAAYFVAQSLAIEFMMNYSFAHTTIIQGVFLLFVFYLMERVKHAMKISKRKVLLKKRMMAPMNK